MQMRRAFTTGLATMLLGTALFIGGGAVAADNDTDATAVINPLPALIVNVDGRDNVGAPDIDTASSDPDTTPYAPETAVSDGAG